MVNADILLPEKYRRILETYEIEREFGYTLESYQSELVINESNTLVSILRVGRIGLYYQTQNGALQGRWDAKSQKWQELPAKYSDAIQQGILGAMEQATPDLLKLPVVLTANLANESAGAVQ